MSSFETPPALGTPASPADVVAHSGTLLAAANDCRDVHETMAAVRSAEEEFAFATGPDAW